MGAGWDQKTSLEMVIADCSASHTIQRPAFEEGRRGGLCFRRDVKDSGLFRNSSAQLDVILSVGQGVVSRWVLRFLLLALLRPPQATDSTAFDALVSASTNRAPLASTIDRESA